MRLHIIGMMQLFLPASQNTLTAKPLFWLPGVLNFIFCMVGIDVVTVKRGEKLIFSTQVLPWNKACGAE